MAEKTDQYFINEVEKLFKEHFQALCLFAYELLQDLEEATDIVHEAFRQILVSPEQESNTLLLETVKDLIRKSCDSHISECRQKELFKKQYQQQPEGETSADDRYLAAELSYVLYLELQKLAPSEVKVLEQLYEHDHTSLEAAQKLNVNRQTVLNAKTLSLKKLRKGLTRKGLCILILVCFI